MLYGNTASNKTLGEASWWKSLRNQALRKHHWTCKRCERRSPDGSGLSIHHIIPLEEGGGHNLENLVVLCDACHDLVEEAGFRTLIDIVATPIEPPSVRDALHRDLIKPKPKTLEGIDVDFRRKKYRRPGEKSWRPAWELWVYGGVDTDTVKEYFGL